MSILSILFFFVMLFGLGSLITFFIKQSYNFFERNIMKLGLGLGLFPILACILNLLHIPLDWKIFTIPAILGIVLSSLHLKKPTINFKSKSNIFIYIVLVLFFITLLMYCKGAFSYSYVEDTDPWGHVVGIKYIATEKNAYGPDVDWTQYVKNRLTYVNPYPPSYDALLAMVYQISGTMIWTMKFFNALIISLGILFFYFFVKRFTENGTIALLSTAVLTMIPSYLSHFIWAHALIVTLFFPLMYCLCFVMGKDKKWMIPAILILASIIVTHPEQAIKLGLLAGIFCFVKFLYKPKLWKVYIPIFLVAGLLSLSWWGPVFFGSGVSNVLDQSFAKVDTSSGLLGGLKVFFSPSSGTATRAYTFSDFVVAKGENMINNPIGWGYIISILLVIFLIILFIYAIKHKKPWMITSLIWFTILFLLVNSMTFHLPIGLMAFRVWMLLAIPVSIICGFGLYLILKKISPKYTAYIIIIILLSSTFFTSFIPKWQTNTVKWGTWFSQVNDEEVTGYSMLPQLLPKGSRVFSMSGFQGPVLAYDMEACEWCEEDMEFGINVLTYSAQDIHDWLVIHNYQYFIIDGRSIRAHVYQYDNNETMTFDAILNIITDIQNSGLFGLIYQNSGIVILEVI